MEDITKSIMRMNISTRRFKYFVTIWIMLTTIWPALAQQINADDQRIGASGILCLNCTVTAPDNAADASLQTFSTLNVALGLAAQTYQELIFTGAGKIAAGTPVTVKLGTGNSLLSLQALGAIFLRPYNGNTAAGPAVAANSLLTVASNNNQIQLKLAPAQTYDRIRITLDGGIVGALNNLYVYGAYYTGASPAVCNTAIDELHGISSGLLNLGASIGGVQNPQRAIDGNISTASTLNAGVGLVGAYAQQTAIYSSVSVPGDSVRLTFAIPQGLIDAGILPNISVTTYNGNNSNNDTRALSSSLLNVRLLDLNNNRRTLTVTYAPPTVFDRVELRLGGGIGSVLSTLELYETQRLIPRPVINYNNTVATNVQLCAGSTATLTATAVPSTTFNWYTTATGGSPVATGSSFTTPALSANTTYYVEAVRSGCTDASERTPVTINVSAIPAAPLIANTNIAVCTGKTATFTAQTVAGVTVNWYTTPAGGTPVFTGDSFTTGALTQNTSYYAEAINGGQCVSPARTQVTATIVAPPAQPVNTPNSVTICEGNVAVLSVSNPITGLTYNWYSSATGGTVLHTGTNFTSPVLNSNTSYYLEAVNSTGCASTDRAQIDVIVQPKPADAVLADNSSTISAGQTATINVTNAQTGNTYNWYTSANASTPVFTGATYQTPALYTSTTYYVGAVSSAGCQSVNRTPVTINVTINSNAPCSFANQQSSAVNGICIGCDINNRALAVDADTTTASTIQVTAGLTGGYAEQELRFQQPGLTGDTVKLVLQSPVNLANVSLLSQIEVALYNGTSQVARYALNASTIQLSLLGGGDNRYAVYVPATSNYDRVTVRLNSALGLLNTLQVYYAVQQFATPVLNPASPEICKGSTASINITSPANGTFNWFTTPTGGSSVFTGTSFTTPVLNANTVYYIEYSRNGCVGPVRQPVQILVNDVPAAPVSAANNVSINSGQTAVLTAIPPANATINWYTSATGGTPVGTGNTFTIPALTANITYYAEAASGNCVSATRTPVNVIVNPIIIPDVAVTPPLQTVNPSQTATFTASSTTPGAIFNWYTSPTGGTAISTGATFTTPAQLANNIYYAEAVIPGTGAVSATRATASVTVNLGGGNTPNPVACDAAIDQTTDINGLLCIGCTVANAGGSVDNDRNTFAQLNVTAGLLNAYAQQTLRFAGTGHAGDSVVVELGTPGSLANAGLLSGIALATYNGTNYNNDRFNVNGSLISVGLINGQSRFRVAFVAQHDFDRVEIRLNSAALGALSSLNIYDAAQEVAAPVITTQNAAACEGSQSTLTATVPSGVTVKWYTSASGGTPVFTGTTFTTPVLNATTTYYAEASKTATGCVQTVRTPATVTVTPVPTAPVINNNTVTVCSGQPATFTAQAVSGATVNWYTLPTGGSPVFTGNSFTTLPLTATTSYYAEALLNGQCVSSSRTQVTVNVSNVVANAVIAQSPVQVCAGSSAVLVATSTQSGVNFNWYTAANGGSPIFTGATFTTPALTANTSYYVEVTAGNCISASRAQAEVIVNPVPAAPTVAINPASAQITSGQTATLTASSATPGAVFNWYTTPTGGSSIFTGTTFTTPALSANTTYYAESTITASGCVSASRTPVTITVNPVFSTNCDFALTQITDINGGALCVGCTVITPNNSVDTDTTNFSRINITAGVVGSYVSQSLIFRETGSVGDSVSIRLRFPVSIASVGALSNIRIGSYNGTTYNNDGILLNNNAVHVQLLPGGQNALVKFAPQATFDRVEIRLSSALASLFNSVDVYYASKQVEAPQLTATTDNVCSGTTATFTVSNARNGVIYNWYTTQTGGTPVFTGATFTTPVLTATTTYYAESSRSVNNCPNPNRVAATANVTPTPVNGVLAQNDLQACAGDAVILTVNNAGTATVHWYDAPTGGNLLFTGANYQVSPISTASYYAELVNGTCTSPGRTQATVTVNPRPAAPGLVAANTQICAGSTATLQVASPENGVTYQWFTGATGGTAVFTGISFTTPVITQNTTYYVQASSAAGCTNNGGRTAVIVTVSGQIDAPVLSSAQTQVCNGGSTSISVVNPVTGLQYHWFTTATGGTLVFTGVTFPLNNLTANATYYVEATNGSGCTSAARTQTTVNVLPAPTQPQVQAPVGGLSVCAGNSAMLSISNPQTDLVYRWFDAATGGTLIYTGTQFNTPALTANTTYYVEAAAAGNCNPSARTAVTVTVNTLPQDAILASANVSVCAGSTATFTISSPQAGVTYQWFDSPARTNKLFEGTTYVTGPITANTTFYVAAVNAAGCASTGLTMAQVTVQSAPGTPVIANGSTTQSCSGSQVVLNIANPQTGLTYNWYTQTTGGAPIATGDTFTTTTLTANATYYAEAVNSTGCASVNRARIDVVINEIPATPVIKAQDGSSNLSVCTGGSATLVATSTTPNVTFNWYTQPTGGTPIFTGATFTTPVLTANTTYYVEAVNNTGGCTSGTRVAIQVTINTLTAPAPQINAADLSICQNSAATLRISNPDASTTYNWYTTLNGTNPIYTGTAFTTPVLTANITYYVQAISTQSCNPSAQIAVNVVVTTQPTTPVLVASMVNACAGSTATLAIASPQTGITYNWYTSASLTNIVFTGPSFTTGSVNANATYYVTASNGSCTSISSASAQVNITPAPTAPTVVSNNVSVCTGTQALLSVNNPQSGFTYNWYAAATGGSVLFSGTTFTTPQVTANTNWYVEAVNATGCNSVTRTAVKVTVIPAPAAPQVSAQGTTVCAGSSTVLNAIVNDPAITISWYATATGGTALFTGNSFTTPVITANTTYYAAASSQGSCVSNTRTPVNVQVQTVLITPVVTVAAVTSSSITFQWAAIPGAASYEISLDGKTFNMPNSGTTGLSHTITGLQPAQSATILVRAIGSSACQLTAISLAITGTTDNPLGNGMFIPNAFSPNGDGNNDLFKVYGNNIKNVTFWIYDQWGELQYRGINQSSGWDGTYKGRQQPVGVYVYLLEATMNDGQVVTKKGTINLLR